MQQTPLISEYSHFASSQVLDCFARSPHQSCSTLTSEPCGSRSTTRRGQYAHPPARQGLRLLYDFAVMRTLAVVNSGAPDEA